jgi:uncharacterized protein (DUF885 family)
MNAFVLAFTFASLAFAAGPTALEKDCVKLQGKGNDGARLTKLMERYWKYQMEEFPEYATNVGYPGQNRGWTDRSLDAYNRRNAELDAPWKVLDSIRRASLKPDAQLNYDLFKHTLGEAREARKFHEEVLAVSLMAGVQNEVPQTLALMPHNTAADYEDLLARLEAVPVLLRQVEALLQEGLKLGITFPKVTIEKALAQFEALVAQGVDKSAMLEPFGNYPPEIAAPVREKLTQRAQEVIKTAVLPGFEKLTAFIRDTYLPGCRVETAWVGLPKGEEWYAFKARQSTTTTLAPKSIHEIGLKEVARITAAMEEVKKRAGFSGSLKDFNAFLRSDPKFVFGSEKELLKAYRDIAKRIDPELPRIFGKLPRLTYGVLPIPAYSAPSQPTAYYQQGSPISGRGGNFFANTYDLKTRYSWEMEALTLHEAVPGHHLQIALAQELEGVPEFRKNEGYNAFIEGWGLYSESLGADVGMYRDPYSDYGRLTYEMWRSIRLVVDTGMHSLGWSREKAIEYFSANAGKSQHDIVQEIDRYLVMPGQALGYKIGQLKILELRRKAEAKLGKKFNVRAFHDAVLENGALPLDILEKRVTAWIRFNGSG